MKLAFVVLDGGMGGHTRTSVSIAKAMRKRGHDVKFFMGTASPTQVVDAARFPVTKVVHGFASTLTRELRAYKPDAVHTFSTLGLINVLDYCDETSTPWVYTRCGGPPVKEPLETIILKLLGMRFATCLSDENKVEILQTAKAKPEDVIVVPARIDVDEILELQSTARHENFRAKYEIESGSPVFLRIARIGPAYRESILDGIAVADLLNSKGVKCTFVHIGYADVPAIAEEIYAARDAANQKHGRVVAVSTKDESSSAQEYLGIADVIYGMGRSVFEGLASGKPTLVVGKVGFAGAVREDTVGPLAETNFSGRGVATVASREESVAQLADELEAIFTDPEYRRELGEFALKYAYVNLDVSVSAPTYEALYEKFRPDWVPSQRERRVAGVIAWIKRFLRSLLSKSLRSQISAVFNLRAKV